MRMAALTIAEGHAEGGSCRFRTSRSLGDASVSTQIIRRLKIGGVLVLGRL
jgi:hypothetical protein